MRRLPTRTGAALAASLSPLGLLLAALGIAAPTRAADVTCGVGTRIEGEMGGGVPGEIAEVGNSAPHQGWYRLVFSWNSPKGDWFDPASWDVHPVGSTDRCLPATGADRPPQSAADAQPSAASATATANASTEGALPSTEQCPHGRAVHDRQQQRGRVLGERNGLCVVQLDAGGSHSYLHWMLTDARSGDTAPAADLPAGRYVCSSAGAGQFPVQLDGEESYLDRAGEAGGYRFDRATAAIEFDSGSLRGQYARWLGPGKFGLASQATTQFYTVCNLQDR